MPSSRAPRPPDERVHRVRTNQDRRGRILTATAGRIEIDCAVPSRPDGELVDEEDGRTVEFTQEVEGIPDLLLTIRQGTFRGPKSVTINLSALTTDEVDCLKDALVAVLDHVRPVCEELDRLAKEDTSGRSNARLYRPVPSLRFGDGQVIIYSEGIPRGPDDVPELVWPAGSEPRRPGDSGPALAGGELERRPGPGNGAAPASELG